MQGHPVSESRVILSHLMLPQDANPAGNVHGGVIMKYIDNAAGVVSVRHSRTNCVTASIDRLDFFKPMFIGELLTLKASLNMVGSTSMEIGVRVEGENLLTGEKKHVASAYLTFVALYGEDAKVKQLPPIIAETADDRRRNEEARYRKAHRLEEKKRMLARQEKIGL
ncbi:acyl-CoA thioesterase [Desulfoluna spongiiphila]|uniref:acyl-CoA thioesterase n=1 Tax=Desulfoluna spongiiphila TaxID=419481 RepID=UPI001255FEBA|nr:acyl-CoA thioesterase [Desulfoluna spongiiphila]VVS92080.1 hotdog acyl-coa thioesterase (acot)-type domain [Desulfoluna spongiiphila]